MNLRRNALDMIIVIGLFVAIQGFAFFYLRFIGQYQFVEMMIGTGSIAQASAMLVGGSVAFASGLVFRKSAKLTGWEVVLLGSLVALFVDLFILPMGYPFLVDSNLIFAIFVFSLFGVVVGYSQFANPRQMRICSASEIVGALVGIGWALVTEQSWRSRVSLLFPDLGLLTVGIGVGAVAGYTIGLYVEIVRLNQKSRRPENLPSDSWTSGERV